MKDIFDVNEKSDIPVRLSRQLTSLRMSNPVRQLISLFNIKNNLTIDEILVGSFREHKKTYKRSWVACTVYNLCQRGLLKKNGLVYELSDNGKYILEELK